MPGQKRTTLLERIEYFGLLEDIVEADPNSSYSRSFLLLDCVDALRFRENERAALADKSALALVRAMSTPRRWSEWFDLGGLAKGDWVAFTLDDDGDAPRAWELAAVRDYASGPARSVRSMRRLGDGSPAPLAAADGVMAFKLASAIEFGRANRKILALDTFSQLILGSDAKDIEILALDVGQASAALIRRGGSPIGLFDAGAPIWFNKGSTAPDFEPPVITNGFVFLSHWDFDHFDLGRRHPPYRQLDWYAPDQIVGPNTAKFQAELGSNLTFVDGTTSSGGFTLARGTSKLPKDRNGSGYVLRYERDGRAVLLTGDTDYTLIPPHMLIGLDAVSIPHHAGQGAGTPTPNGSSARAIASYGLPNSYRHPHAATIAAHMHAGWLVTPTAAGLLPRGDRQLYP